ncbi:MAG: pyridoxal phosphate-dependent aminotransferase [Candidatus Omnitrophica bacterium]|nr:pyridoxal phosphate-dependent aminotransferase [Candidatus Omnitrophota bacterium]
MVSERLHGLEASPTLALAAKAKALAKAGKSVADFTAGEPDFPTPLHIKQAAIQAIEKNFTKYTPVAGIPELRQAIASDLSRRLGIRYEPGQVIVSCGAKHVLYNALQAICSSGEEVIILTPYWVSYPALVRLAGGRPVFVETRESERFQPDPEAVGSAVTSRTRALILNSPSNPTGMLIEAQRLAALARLAKRHELVVISDEIYDRIVFPSDQPCSIVQADPSIADRTIIVNGVSKSYSMTGWRIGYAAAPADVIEAMITLQSHATSNPASISQSAALAAVAGDQAEVGRMVEEFHRRRDRLVDGLNRLKGLSCIKPQGAFYAWCNVRGLGLAADAVAERWLDDALVAVVPGEGFGSPEHVRFSFAASMETIDDGLARINRWLEKGK